MHLVPAAPPHRLLRHAARRRPRCHAVRTRLRDAVRREGGGGDREGGRGLGMKDVLRTEKD